MPSRQTKGGWRAADAALSSAAGLRAPPQSPEAGAPPGDAELARTVVAAAPAPAPQRRAPQPFTMHKMAFHRGRVLGILRAALRASLPLDAAEVAAAEVRRLGIGCIGVKVSKMCWASCALRCAPACRWTPPRWPPRRCAQCLGFGIEILNH